MKIAQTLIYSNFYRKRQFDAKSEVEVEISKYSSPGFKKILQKFSTVLREELTLVLLPERSVNHEIEADENAKPLHMPLYQLSPVELKAMRDYVQEVLGKGNIRPRKFPYGAPIFFDKEDDKPLRFVADYRGLNRIK